VYKVRGRRRHCPEVSAPHPITTANPDQPTDDHRPRRARSPRSRPHDSSPPPRRPRPNHTMAIFKRALLLAAAAAAAFTVAAASDITEVAVAGPAPAADVAPADALVDVSARSGSKPRYVIKCFKKPVYRIKYFKVRVPVVIRKHICKRIKVPCRRHWSNKMLDTAEPGSEAEEPADAAAPAAEAEQDVGDASLDAVADREGLEDEGAADEAVEEEEEEEEGAADDAAEASDALDTASRSSWKPRYCIKRKCFVKKIVRVKLVIRQKRVLVGYRKVCKRVYRRH